MKKKISLSALKVKSFVTNSEKAQIQGGKTTVVVYTDLCKESDWCFVE